MLVLVVQHLDKNHQGLAQLGPLSLLRYDSMIPLNLYFVTLAGPHNVTTQYNCQQESNAAM